MGQIQSMGTVVKSAAGKAKSAVVSTFSTTPSGDPDDPTSLASMPSSVAPEVWVANGQLCETQGNYTKALDNYTKALELEPKNQSALLSTARLYQRQNQTSQAIVFFQKAVNAKPNDAAAYNELGLAQAKAGNLAEGESNLQKAIAIEPTKITYRNSLAGLMVDSGRSDEAVKQLSQVQSPALANYSVGYMYATRQNIAAAQQHLQTALQIDPNLQQARDLMARLGGGNVIQQATHAYQTAGNVLQSVQGMTNPYAANNQTVSYPAGASSPVAPSQPSLK